MGPDPLKADIFSQSLTEIRILYRPASLINLPALVKNDLINSRIRKPVIQDTFSNYLFCRFAEEVQDSRITIVKLKINNFPSVRIPVGTPYRFHPNSRFRLLFTNFAD
jgi:hypothetical protein